MRWIFGDEMNGVNENPARDWWLKANSFSVSVSNSHVSAVFNRLNSMTPSATAMSNRPFDTRHGEKPSTFSITKNGWEILSAVVKRRHRRRQWWRRRHGPKLRISTEFYLLRSQTIFYSCACDQPMCRNTQFSLQHKVIFFLSLAFHPDSIWFVLCLGSHLMAYQK